MVERQLRQGGITDERVLWAMGDVPREEFVATQDRKRAYQDGACRIAEGQTISQPWIVARMTELLCLRGGERVLEIGTGSGYGAAVLSLCAAEVVTIERHAALAEAAAHTLSRLGYGNVEVRHGDGSLGAADRAPFDGMSITATVSDALPQALREQLAPGAPVAVPIAQEGEEFLMRLRDNEAEAIAPVRFVPLRPGSEA